MDYPVFEGRVLELVYKTDARLTPQLVAFKIGCTVEHARANLDHMVLGSILSLESDDAGNPFYEMAGRPAPTGEILSWQQAPQAPPMAGAPWQPQTWQPQMSGPQMSAPPQVYLQQQINYAPQVVPVAVQPDKSVALAGALGFLLGPLGMLYATPLGALAMFVVSLFLVGATAGAALVVTAPTCAVWAALAASGHNQRNRLRLAGVAQATALPMARPY